MCNCNNLSSYNQTSPCAQCTGSSTTNHEPVLLDCNTLYSTMQGLKQRFEKCKILSASDMDLLVDVMYSLSQCDLDENLHNNIVTVYNLPDVNSENEVHSQINQLTQFDVSEIELVIFEVNVKRIPYKYILKIGKGSYGNGGVTLLNASDIYLLSKETNGGSGNTSVLSETLDPNNTNNGFNGIGKHDDGTGNIVYISETITSLTEENGVLSYKAEGNKTTNIDLKPIIDDAIPTQTIPNLQEVTDEGNITTNPIISKSKDGVSAEENGTTTYSRIGYEIPNAGSRGYLELGDSRNGNARITLKEGVDYSNNKDSYIPKNKVEKVLTVSVNNIDADDEGNINTITGVSTSILNFDTTNTTGGSFNYTIINNTLIVNGIFTSTSSGTNKIIGVLPTNARPNIVRYGIAYENKTTQAQFVKIDTNGEMSMLLNDPEIYIIDFEINLNLNII